MMMDDSVVLSKFMKVFDVLIDICLWIINVEIMFFRNLFRMYMILIFKI